MAGWDTDAREKAGEVGAGAMRRMGLMGRMGPLEGGNGGRQERLLGGMIARRYGEGPVLTACWSDISPMYFRYTSDVPPIYT